MEFCCEEPITVDSRLNKDEPLPITMNNNTSIFLVCDVNQ